MPYKDPIKRKENNEKYRKKYQKELREKNKKWREENKQHLKEYFLKYRNTFTKGSPEQALYLRRRMLMRTYGITLEQYEEILKNQNGVCAICEKPPGVDKNGKFISLAVDHHHKYKGLESVRGLLCWTCNRRLISNLGDRENAVELFSKAAEYVKRYNEKMDIRKE